MTKKRKIILTCLCVLVALISIFVIGKYAGSLETYEKLGIVQILDKKISDVTGIGSTMSAISIGLGVLPGNVGTPFATQISSINSFLIVILAVIYLEKYALTIIGILVFMVIIPIVSIIYIVAIWSNKDSLTKIGKKILLFSLVLVLLIPTSVKITEFIDNTYETNLKTRIEEEKLNSPIVIQKPSTTTQNNTQTEDDEDKTWFEEIGDTIVGAIDSIKESINNAVDSVTGAIDSAAQSITNVTDYVKNQMAKFMEATAVMLVTSCFIPLLTFLVFNWLSKSIFDADVKSSKLLDQNNKLIEFLAQDKKEETKETTSEPEVKEEVIQEVKKTKVKKARKTTKTNKTKKKK